MPAKSDYVKVFEIMKQAMKRAQRVNKLVSVQIQTEDTKLKTLTDTYLTQMKATRQATGGFLVRGSLDGSERDQVAYRSIEALKQAGTVLMSYCEEMIASAKPQWQILAERNGWQPAKPF